MIKLADGASWCIRAGHPQAVDVVKSLGAAMRLEPGASGRELVVIIGQEARPPVNLSGPGPAVVTLAAPVTKNLQALGMFQVGLAMGRETLSRGGLLIHGALAASRKGGGVILAGVGGVGKTTASRRLPVPWRALSDDATLIVRDRSGRYWAHPWPTWSRFYADKGVPGPGGSWDVQHCLPLQAVFILSQSAADRSEILPSAPATAMLMEVVQHVSHVMRRHLTDAGVEALHQQQLTVVEEVVRTLPVFRLQISLDGPFWNEIDRVLDNPDPVHRNNAYPPVKPAPEPLAPCFENSQTGHSGELYIVYTGPSMNPTLREPDLLTVMPYAGSVRTGDVIYYQCPEKACPVVHRVTRVTAAGIRTRGDNNRQEDPGPVQPEAVMGRVVSARRAKRQRRVAGGTPGKLIAAGCRLRLVAAPFLLSPLRFIDKKLAETGLVQKILPPGFRPRVFVFTTRQQSFFKLILKDRVIGHYDWLRETWQIRRPFHLLIDPARLPCPEQDDN